jgi:hypothetical protein
MNPELQAALQQDPAYVAELARITQTYPPDEQGYVRLEDVSAHELNSTAQYTSRYVTGEGGVPPLAADLDIVGDPDRFDKLRIRASDVPVFLGRIAAYKAEQIAKLRG